MTEYRQMWTDLGLKLEPHDTLLDVLGGVYKSTFMTQQNRPKAMGYFDFVISEVHGLRVKELQDARATGRKVIGTFCVFVPEELILAADAIDRLREHGVQSLEDYFLELIKKENQC